VLEESRIKQSVFLNIPYDHQFEHLCLAYVCAIACFGLVPRTTLEIPGDRRLNRIIDLIAACPISIHDLSRVQLDRTKPRTPRFNMPFELGLAIAREKFADADHGWFVFESVHRRAEKSLSDIAGTDVYVHDGTIRGVLRQVSNALIRQERRSTLDQMLTVYRHVSAELPAVLRASGAKSIFDGARTFAEVCMAAAVKAEETV
jgi:hypothetical protein